MFNKYWPFNSDFQDSSDFCISFSSFSLALSLSHTHTHTNTHVLFQPRILPFLTCSLSLSLALSISPAHTSKSTHALSLTHPLAHTHTQTHLLSPSLAQTHKRTYSLLFKDIYSCIVFKGNLKSASFLRVDSSSQNFSPHQKLEIAQVWRKI